MTKSLIFPLIAALCLAAYPEKIIPVIAENSSAPPFMLPGLDDERVSLRDFCGQPRMPRKSKRYITLLSFMASYCVPCRQEIPQIEAYAKEAGDDVKVVFISVDTVGAEAVAAFRQQMKMEQTVLLDRFGQVMKKYGVQRLPSLFIIDKNGDLRYQNLEGLPPDVSLTHLIKEKVAAVRSHGSLESAVAPNASGQNEKKMTALNLLLSGRSEESVIHETGLSADDVDKLKSEIQSVMKARWGLE